MRKPSRKKWQFKSSDFDSSLALASEVGVSPFAAQLLINRGIKTAAEAQSYLYPSLDGLHSPFKLAGMDKAVERIHKAISRGEKICVYGDYDVDGTTATALLLNTFRQMDVPVDYYIPNRFGDGYGLSEDTVEKIHQKNEAKLLITVDCGITSVKEIALANKLGIDVIVTDHHQPEEEQPPAYALISPKIPGNEYPYTELAGVGLAFKLAQALADDTAFLESQLDLVALGTVADIAPLTGENRILSRLGLIELDKRERLGIHALCEVAGHKIDTPLDGYAISFKLGPRINAAGRMDTAHKVVDLLTTDSKDVATRIASELNRENHLRQELGKQIQEEASKIIENEIDDDTVGIVVASDKWDEKAEDAAKGKEKGVVGIIAARLMRTFHRPIVILAIDGDEATGSGRCIDGMNLADSFVACTELLVKHGGHAAAAGLTLKTKNIPKFRKAFNEFARETLTEDALQPKLDLEFETRLSLLTLETLKELEQFEPFGKENPAPYFGTRRVKVNGVPTQMGKEKNHLRMFVSDGMVKRCAIDWGAGDKLITFRRPNMSLNIAFAPQINEWQRNRSVQLILQDWELHSEGRDTNWEVFPKLSDKSSVKLVDKRNVNKKNYLLNLLAREESCIIYVRDEEMLDILLTKLLPESIEGIARHTEATSETEAAALLKQLENGELQTIASSNAFSRLEALPFVKHVVFCHLASSQDIFSKRCEPAFATAETSYLHLIYNNTDESEMRNWISEKYPADDELRRLYGSIRAVIQSNGTDGYPEAEILKGGFGSLAALQTGLTIFEELQFIERHGKPGSKLVKLLSGQKNDLSRSPTYLKGEWIKQTSPSFIEFQLKENIKSMWERIAHEYQILSEPNSNI
ncbi:MAG: single-stranded-DNA-specific exonuclease RecJ [Candidatus Poribacteria bacterium]|nr:single-stranded-DNA-specific exonuclease RecJ [Candidatus Poribacteria bacterium]